MFDVKGSSRIDGRNELLAQIKIRMITDYDLNHGLGVDNFVSEIKPFIKNIVKSKSMKCQILISTTIIPNFGKQYLIGFLIPNNINKAKFL